MGFDGEVPKIQLLVALMHILAFFVLLWKLQIFLCVKHRKVEDVPLLPHAMLTPVVFVVFGKLPLYLYMNIELVSRKNHVIIISDSVGQREFLPSPSDYNIIFEPMSQYESVAIKFSGIYKHLCKDRSPQRRLHEMRCIQRWLILCEYMRRHASQIYSTFFSDGDSYLFVNAHEAFKERTRCDAVINVESQGSRTHWVASGEASIWTYKSISEFSNFVFLMYESSHFQVWHDAILLF